METLVTMVLGWLLGNLLTAGVVVLFMMKNRVRN